MPVIDQDEVVPGTGRSSASATPRRACSSRRRQPTAGGLIWGVGPAFLWPTATDDELGTGKWGVGPTGVGLLQKGPWTYGMLANHIWSFAGDDDRADVNSTFLQPFFAYNTKRRSPTR